MIVRVADRVFGGPSGSGDDDVFAQKLFDFRNLGGGDPHFLAKDPTQLDEVDASRQQLVFGKNQA